MVGEKTKNVFESANIPADELEAIRAKLGLDAINQVGDIVSRKDLPKYVPRREGESLAGYEARLMNIFKGQGTTDEYNALLKSVAEGEGGGQAPEGSDQKPEQLLDNFADQHRDKHGNTWSKESMERMAKLATENPEAFYAELQAHDESQQRAIEAAQNEGYKQAQVDIANILNGMAPAEYLEKTTADLKVLEEWIQHNEAALQYVHTNEARDILQKHITAAQSDYNAMMHKYQMINQMRLGEGAAIGVDMPIDNAPQAELFDQNTQYLASMLDPLAPDYETERRVRDASIDAIAQTGLLTPAELEVVRRRAANMTAQEGLKAQDELSVDETPSPAGQETPSEDEFEDPRRNKPAVSEADRKKQYRRAMTKLAQESKSGRFDAYDDELQRQLKAEKQQAANEKERGPRVKELLGKIGGRVAFKNWSQKHKRTAIQSMLGLTMTVMLASPFVKLNSRASAPGESYGVTQEYVGAEGGASIETKVETQAQSVEADNVLGLTEADLTNFGELRLEDWDLLAEGEKIYEGFMDREGSEEYENGLYVNKVQYNDFENKHSHNSYGWSGDWVYDIEDEGERNATAIREILTISRDQPQTLASFAASCPHFLTAAGVSDEIVGIKDVAQRANAVLELLMGENGGELQKRLMGAASIALHNENTTFDFYQEYGREATFYIKDDKLGIDVKKRDGNKQVQIVITYADGTQDISDKNLPCGWQENLDEQTHEVREVFTNKAGEVTFVTAETAVEYRAADEQASSTSTEYNPDDGDPDDDEDDEDDEDPDDGDKEEKQKKSHNREDYEREGNVTDDMGDSDIGELTEDPYKEGDTADEEREGMLGTEEEIEQQEEADASEITEGLSEEEQNKLIEEELARQQQQQQNATDDTSNTTVETSNPAPAVSVESSVGEVTADPVYSTTEQIQDAINNAFTQS